MTISLLSQRKNFSSAVIPGLSSVKTITIALLLSFVAVSFVQAQDSATIATDKPDYEPRSTAVFTGSGFKPYEDVVLKVKNLSYPCNTVLPDSSYTPWTVQADA